MSDEVKVQTKGLNKKLIFIAVALIAVGLVVALVSLVPTSSKAKKVEEQLNLGAKYLSELDYEQAIVAYEAVIKIDPKCEEAYLALVDVYIATGELDKAEEVLKRAEEALGSDATDAISKKKKEVENLKEEQNQAEFSTSGTIENSTEPLAPVTHTIYEGTTVELSEAKVGDVVLFGAYEQDNIASNGVEDIPWYVLDKDGDNLLLMSVYLLDAVPYHGEGTGIFWEYCSLRQWMNNDFYNSAFSNAEKKHIRTSDLENADNPLYGTEGGNATEDKVFALSASEAEQYFGIEDAMDYWWYSAAPELSAAKVTAYAKAQGVWVSDYESTVGNGSWWLRTPGSSDYSAAHVFEDGSVSLFGGGVGNFDNGARPALWLNLKP